MIGPGIAFVAGFFLGAVVVVLVTAVAVAGEEEALQENTAEQSETPLG